MLKLEFDFDHGEFDLVLGPYGLEHDPGLTTPVIISIFTDARALDGDEIPDGSGDPRGWWGDTYPDVEGHQLGSRLWLLERATSVASTFRFARDRGRDALRWLVEDGIAVSVDCQAERGDTGFLVIVPSVTRPDEDVQRWRDLWNGTIGAG
jgi:phage gp46-like protein